MPTLTHKRNGKEEIVCPYFRLNRMSVLIFYLISGIKVRYSVNDLLTTPQIRLTDYLSNATFGLWEI